MAAKSTKKDAKQADAANAVELPAMPRLQEKYIKEVLPHLKEKLQRTNPHALPKLTKIVVSMGVGSAVTEKKHMEEALADGDAGQAAFKRGGDVAAAQLQRGRLGFKGADQGLTTVEGDAVMQGQQAVGLDDLGHESFSWARVWRCSRSCARIISTTPMQMAESATLKAGQP